MAILELGIELNGLSLADKGLKDLQKTLSSMKGVKIDVGASALNDARVQAIQANTAIKEMVASANISNAKFLTDLKGEGLKAKTELISVNSEIKKLESASKINISQGIGNARIETENARKALIEYNLEQKKLKDLAKASATPNITAGEGSIVQMRTRLNELRKVYDNLSESARNSARVQNNLVGEINRINQAVSNAEQATGRFQRNVGNYSSALGNANGVTMEFNRIIQDAPFGMMGIGNNIQQLASNWQVYSQQARDAAAANGQTIGTMGLLRGVMSNFLTTGNLLTFGIAAITSAWTAYTMWAQKANKEQKALNNGTKEYIDTLSALDRYQLQGAKSAQQELVNLELLNKVYNSNTASQEKRKEAYNGIMALYESYFGELTKEEKKIFDVKNAYDSLRPSILATAKARAAENIIVKNQEKYIENEQKRIKLYKDYKKAEEDLAKASKRGASEGNYKEQYERAKSLEKYNEARMAYFQNLRGNEAVEKENNALIEKTVKLLENEADITHLNSQATESSTNATKEKNKALKKQIDHLKEIYSLSGLSAKDYALIGSVGIQYDVDSINYDLNQKISDLQAYQSTILKDTTLTEKKRTSLIAETEKAIQFLTDRALIDVISLRDKYSQELSKTLSIKPITNGVAEIGLFEEAKVPEWLKESKRLTKELSKEITNIIGMLPNLSGGFSDIFRDLTSGIGSLFQKELINNLSETLSAKMKEIDADTMKIAGALTIAGQTLQGLFNKSSALGQGAGGALSGAGAGLGIGSMLTETLGKNAGIWGAAIGGVVGLVSGIFGGKKKRKEEERQRQQLEEQKRTNALLERMNALAYTSSIIGGKTANGIVTGVNRNEFGEITFRIEGKDLVASMNRQGALSSR